MKVKTAEHIISSLESIDLEHEEAYEKVMDVLNNNIKGFRPIKFKLNYHDELYYVRARILNKPEDYVEEISGHSYNPYLDKIGYGRVNKERQQILYLGRTRITALAEVNIIENKKEEMEVGYSLSRWTPIKELSIGAILDPNTMNRIEADEMQDFLNFVTVKYKDIQKDPNQAGAIKLNSYFSSKFTERIVKGEEYKYKITCALSNFILKQNPTLNGLMYQSVKWPQAYNLAITKSTVDEYSFKPTHFVKMVFLRKEVDDLTEKSFEIAKSFNENTNFIEW
jgi:hypothetical protein